MAICAFVLVQVSLGPPARAAMPLRIAVASNTVPACGEALAPQAIRDNAVARLNGAGITVSNIHNARLDIDFDCVGVGSNARNNIAVHECLTYSELVSAPSNSSKSILASTWRKCESYTCNRAACSVAARYGGQLLDEFFSEHNFGGAEPSTGPAPVNGQVPASPAPTLAQPRAQRAMATGTQHRPAYRSVMAGPLVFSGIIMNCLCVFVYWQFRRRPGYSD